MNAESYTWFLFLKKHFILVIGCVCSFLSWAALWQHQHRRTKYAIEPLELSHQIQKKSVEIWDIREWAHYSKQHIPHARHMPESQWPHCLSKAKTQKSTVIVFIAHEKQAIKKILRTMKNLGYLHVRVLRGGMPAWIQASLPVSRKSSKM